jgi:Acetyltransferase (GNAT) domain
LKINKEMVKDRTPHVSEASYRQFRDLCFFLRGRGQLLLRAVTKKQQNANEPPGSPLAIVLFLRDKDRIYLLQATTSAEGRDIGANHFLLDHVIREFAGQPMTLDFEGSDLPGIAHFYKSFGAQDQPYFFYRHNRLPWPFRQLK